MRRFCISFLTVLIILSLSSCLDRNINTGTTGETNPPASSAVHEDTEKSTVSDTDTFDTDELYPDESSVTTVDEETKEPETSAVDTTDTDPVVTEEPQPTETSEIPTEVESQEPETSATETSDAEEEYADISFTLVDGVLTISGEGKMPDYWKEKLPVVDNSPWWSNMQDVEKVIIEEGITSIGANAFPHYPKLTSVVIPEGVTSIGRNAFAYCYYLEEIILPDSLEFIGDEAFTECVQLTVINIPATVNHIGDMAFSGIRNLTAINVDDDNASYVDVDGVLFTRDMTEILVFPIQKSTLSTEYTVPDGVTTIGSAAFEECAFEKVHLPETVINIGENAFYWCYRLKECNIPSGVKVISTFAFSDCHISKIVIPSGVTTIESHAFHGCNTTEDVFIPETVTHIGNGALVLHKPGDEGATIHIPAGLTDIHPSAFGDVLSDIESIVYGGTMAEWSAMNIELPSYGTILNRTTATVHCSDGDITN